MTPRATSPPRPWISRATFAIAHNVDQPYRSSVHRQPQSPLPIRSSSSPFIPGMPPLFVGHWASSPTCLQPSHDVSHRQRVPRHEPAQTTQGL
ncbi:hypothetical protein SORBI_3007G090406 [Sorghum bicolor]|uniref:Uncharacterized protein n=1 Tax=Sorghum bicolor TaxID=4558 RepID=A0A1Z5R9Q5_SORBI|nr:hypothetical protein SORBI_3007G090406 [Sorghum bicolor]